MGGGVEVGPARLLPSPLLPVRMHIYTVQICPEAVVENFVKGHDDVPTLLLRPYILRVV